jgi:hypothetical protein
METETQRWSDDQLKAHAQDLFRNQMELVLKENGLIPDKLDLTGTQILESESATVEDWKGVSNNDIPVGDRQQLLVRQHVSRADGRVGHFHARMLISVEKTNSFFQIFIDGNETILGDE